MSMDKIFCSAFFGPETIIIECRSRVASIFLCHTWYFRDHLEDLGQVDTEKENWEDLIMMTKNIIKYMCCTIFKMASNMQFK